jgi:hypothetical protein
MNPLRVAAFQRRPHFDDVSGVLGRLTEDLEWCRQQDVHLALFPECYLQGYATDRETIVARSLALDGYEVREILSVLREYPTTIIFGLIERRGAAFLNSAIAIRNGRVLGTYAKTHPNEPGFDAGTDYPIFTTHNWRFGINICNDANFPDAALNVSRQGAAPLLSPEQHAAPKECNKVALKERQQSPGSGCRDRLLDHIVRCCWSPRQPDELRLYLHRQPERRRRHSRSRRSGGSSTIRSEPVCPLRAFYHSSSVNGPPPNRAESQEGPFLARSRSKPNVWLRRVSGPLHGYAEGQDVTLVV